jgi:hypothetical protein
MGSRLLGIRGDRRAQAAGARARSSELEGIEAVDGSEEEVQVEVGQGDRRRNA